MPPVPGQDAQIHFRQADLARILARDADVGRHGDLQAAAHAVSVQCGDHQLGRVLQAQQRLIGMQAEVILESRIDADQHLDVRAGGKEFIARAGQHDHVHIVVHARLEDGLIELPVHLVGVGIGRRIAQFDHRHTGVHPVVDQLFRSFAACRLYCRRHRPTPFRNLKMSVS